MKKNYTSPELDFIKVQANEILTASNEEVFVDGESLFG